MRFSNIVGRVRRQENREQHWNWLKMTPEERYQERLRQKRNEIKAKLFVQAFLSAFLSIIFIYMIINIQKYTFNSENITNITAIGLCALVGIIITNIRIKRYKRGDYDVE